MAIILAFDQSIARTGWAVYEPPSVTSMLIGSFTSRPRTHMETEEKTGIFCDEIEKLFKAHKPNFVVWEAAAEDIRQFRRKPPKKPSGDMLVAAQVAPPKDQGPLTVNADQLILRDIQGHIRHAARARRIPYESVHPKTWRAAILKNGNLDKEAAKRKAREFCQMLRIGVKNDDQAEAVCIALWAATCDKFRWLNSQSGKLEPLFKGAA